VVLDFGEITLQVIVVESLEHFDVGKYEDVVDMAVT
jgi:hypothetical protein